MVLSLVALFLASPSVDVQQMLTRLVEASGVPGAAVVHVKADGRLETHYAGLAEKGTSRAVSPSTLFHAASLSKQITAWAALGLAERGELDLDRPLDQYVGGVVEPDDFSRSITARHVLSHASGLPNWRNQKFGMRAHFKPGSQFSYSGEGYVWLSKVIEKITGTDFETYVRATVFVPLQMNSTTFVWKPGLEAVAVVGHDLHGRATSRRGSEKANAAASLLTTAGDYGRFLKAVMGGPAAMYQPTVKVTRKCASCLGSDAADLPAAFSWGLGWALWNHNGQTEFFQWGDNGSFKAFVTGDRKRGEAVAIFTNSEGGMGIVPPVVQALGFDPAPVDQWLRYERYDSSRTALSKRAEQRLVAGDNEGLADVLREWLRSEPDNRPVRKVLELVETNKMPRRSPAGNAVFQLSGHSDAKSVVVTGSFNEWHRFQFPMEKGNRGWATRLQIPAGRYTYMFIVDGKWITDPENKEQETNASGNSNSVLVVQSSPSQEQP
ncbi:MAG TPA: serine hydrolase [Bryobacteraceae bacterium]|nr:serine hydrolase [Bryobacteraceae bacterium]